MPIHNDSVVHRLQHGLCQQHASCRAACLCHISGWLVCHQLAVPYFLPMRPKVMLPTNLLYIAAILACGLVQGCSSTISSCASLQQFWCMCIGLCHATPLSVSLPWPCSGCVCGTRNDAQAASVLATVLNCLVGFATPHSAGMYCPDRCVQCHARTPFQCLVKLAYFNGKLPDP